MNTNQLKNPMLIWALLVLTLGAANVTAQTALDDPSAGKAIPSAGKAIAMTRPRKSSGALDPVAILRDAKVIYVKSTSLLVGPAVIEGKLRNRKEFEQLGLMITRDYDSADLVLEVRHDLFTKYVFSAVDPYTNLVVASGKLSSLGGTVAGKVAERFLKQVMRAK